MSAASRPDESISGDAGTKKKKEEGEEKKKMKKKELIGKWCPAEQTHLLVAKPPESPEISCVICFIVAPFKIF